MGTHWLLRGWGLAQRVAVVGGGKPRRRPPLQSRCAPPSYCHGHTSVRLSEALGHGGGRLLLPQRLQKGLFTCTASTKTPTRAAPTRRFLVWKGHGVIFTFSIHMPQT